MSEFYFNRRVRFLPIATCTMCYGTDLPVVEAYCDNIERRPKGKAFTEHHHERAFAKFCVDCWARLGACWPAES